MTALDNQCELFEALVSTKKVADDERERRLRRYMQDFMQTRAGKQRFMQTQKEFALSWMQPGALTIGAGGFIKVFNALYSVSDCQPHSSTTSTHPLLVALGNVGGARACS